MPDNAIHVARDGQPAPAGVRLAAADKAEIARRETEVIKVKRDAEACSVPDTRYDDMIVRALEVARLNWTMADEADIDDIFTAAGVPGLLDQRPYATEVLSDGQRLAIMSVDEYETEIKTYQDEISRLKNENFQLRLRIRDMNVRRVESGLNEEGT